MKDAFWFQHDSNARNDVRLLELRAELGWEGYGLWWALVEQLRESADYRLSNDKLGGLAMGMGVPKKQLETLLALCFDLCLLDLEDGYFFAPALCRRMEAWDTKRAARVSAGSKGGSVRAQREAAAKAKGTHTAQEWQQVLAFCGNQCARCGSTENLQKDHIKPIYQGGSDCITNIQPLCKTCNTSKGPDNTDHRLRFAQAMLAPIPSKLEALLKLEENIREENKTEESSSFQSEEAAPQKKMGEVTSEELQPDSPATPLRTPGGAADVGTAVEPPADKKPKKPPRALLTGDLADLLNPGGIAERVQTMKSPLTQFEADALCTKYGTEAARQIVKEMANYAKLTNNLSANLTAQKWLDKRQPQQTSVLPSYEGRQVHTSVVHPGSMQGRLDTVAQARAELLGATTT